MKDRRNGKWLYWKRKKTNKKKRCMLIWTNRKSDSNGLFEKRKRKKCLSKKRKISPFQKKKKLLLSKNSTYIHPKRHKNTDFLLFLSFASHHLPHNQPDCSSLEIRNSAPQEIRNKLQVSSTSFVLLYLGRRKKREGVKCAWVSQHMYLS